MGVPFKKAKSLVNQIAVREKIEIRAQFKRGITMKKNLVIVRAGANSLHRHWLDQPFTDRSFDTLISYYDAEAYAAFVPEEGVKAVLRDSGGKWDNIQKCLGGLDWKTYEYICGFLMTMCGLMARLSVSLWRRRRVSARLSTARDDGFVSRLPNQS